MRLGLRKDVGVMPKVSLLLDSNKYRRLGVLVNGAAAIDGKSAEDISVMLKMSEPTARKYMRNPEKLPWETLCLLCRKLGIPIEELRECVKY